MKSWYRPNSKYSPNINTNWGIKIPFACTHSNPIGINRQEQQINFKSHEPNRYNSLFVPALIFWNRIIKGFMNL